MLLIKRLPLILCAIVCAWPNSLVNAQQLDSLFSVWQDKNAPTVSRIDAVFLYLAQQQTNLHPDSILHLSRQAYTLSKSLNADGEQQKLKAAIVFSFGLRLKDSTIQSIRVIEEVLPSTRDFEILNITLYNTLSANFHKLGNFEQAIHYALKSEQSLQALHPRYLRTRILNKSNLAGLYLELGAFEEVQSKIEEGMQLIEQHNDHRSLLLYFLSNKGELLKRQEKWPQAKAVIIQALESLITDPLSTKLEKDSLQIHARYLEIIANNYANLVEALLAEEKYDSAQAILPNLKLAAEVSASAFNTCKALEWEGRLLLQKNAPAAATQACKEALEVSESSGLLEQKRDAAECLYLGYKEMGDYKQAVKYLEVFKTTADSLLNSEAIREAERIKAGFELRLLEAKQQEQQALSTLALNKKQQFIYLLAVILVLAIALAAVLYYENQKRKRLNEQLSVLNNRIERMVRSVSHDLIGNLDLAISSTILYSMGDTGASQKPMMLIRDALKSLKDYALRLLQMPFISEYVDYRSTDPNPALEETLLMFNEALGKKSFRTKSLPLPSLDLPDFIIRQLFHNLMTNTLKHGVPDSERPSLSIYPRKSSSDAEIVWENNGPALTPAQHEQLFRERDDRHSGLNLLKANLEQYGYSINVDTQYDTGVRFVIRKL